MNNATPITTQLAGFAILALVLVALGSFKQTHMIAVWLMGFIALAIVIRFASKGSSTT
jgi:uncharacterized membrane protein